MAHASDPSENRNAPSSSGCPAFCSTAAIPDEETLARAALTYCIDGADALMYATIKGAGSAVEALRLIDKAREGNANTAVRHELDQVFATGTARWGRKVNARGMNAFHQSLERWQTWLDRMPTRDPSNLADWFTVSGSQWVIGPTSPYWPHQLDDLSTHKAWASPLCLWGKGDQSALTSCASPIAVVGSRGVNDYGRYVARSVARNAAEAGHLVVSGGAYGADAAAHWGALESMSQLGSANSGRTVAVFAGGLNHIGPERNRELFDHILASHGALISELNPETVPEARRFLLRNRIIAAMASTVVVAQARIRSGALNTATWACDLGREVYAAPGDINTPGNTGCNHLIRENRAMLLDAVSKTNEICHAPHAPVLRCENKPQSEANVQTEPQQQPAAEQGNQARSQPQPAPATRQQHKLEPREQMVLTAIRRCKRRKIATTYDGLLSMLNKPYVKDRTTKAGKQDGAEPWTIASLNAQLGAMELEGTVVEHNGVFNIATGNAQDQPASRPPRRSRDPSPAG